MPDTQDLPSGDHIRVGKRLDSQTVEVLALTVFRAIFGHGVRVPLKMKGVMDMDLVVKDGNVLLNMNQMQLEGPELKVWRFTFAYHDKPVVEYGRGIKNDMKIHFPQLTFLLLTMWRDHRRNYKLRLREARARESAGLAFPEPNAEASEEPTA
jgi:hypothetical protein